MTTTSQTFTFIDSAPTDRSKALQIRRKIRSHVAKASSTVDTQNGSTSSSLPSKTKGRRRRKPYLTWTVHIGGVQPEDELNLQVQLNSQSRSDSEDTSETASLQTPISGSAMIPASKSRVFHEPFVSVVMDNYLRHLAVAIPEIDGEGHSALLKSRWFPMVLNSPIVFQVIVLFSASHYASYQQNVALAEKLLTLKQCALAGIAKSLTSSTQGTGAAMVHDELIAATAKMASYEAIYGDEAAYHSHMEGVGQMLKLRGGMDSLGLEGFLARLLVFIDTNSAFLLKTHLHLSASSFPRLEPFLLPNPSRFIGEV